MKQEFITSKGEIIIERDTLFIKNYKTYFEDTIVAKIVSPIILIGIIIWRIASADHWLDYLRGIVWIVLFFAFFKKFFDVLFKSSLAFRISLSRIKGFEVKQEINPLETEVILHLSNGRYRSIIFRTLENQWQPFTQIVSQYISQHNLSFE